MSAQIVILPKGTLSPADKARLGKAGVVYIESDTPEKIVAMIPGVPLASGNDLLMAAMSGLEPASAFCHETFIQELRARLANNEAAQLSKGGTK